MRGGFIKVSAPGAIGGVALVVAGVAVVCYYLRSRKKGVGPGVLGNDIDGLDVVRLSLGVSLFGFANKYGRGNGYL